MKNLGIMVYWFYKKPRKVYKFSPPGLNPSEKFSVVGFRLGWMAGDQAGT